MAEILLADDDRVARAAFRALLEGEGFSVRLARDGEEAVAAFRARRPDLVLLDVMMPRKNGLAACGEMRALDARVPILFFTAMPSDVSLVRGLGMGADDYIPKDRSPEEFVARVARALRRSADAAAPDGAPPDRLSLGGAEVDFREMTVDAGAGREDLTKSEVQFLQLLASDRGRVFTIEDIFSALRGEGYRGEASAIRSLVLRLKRKLGRGGNLVVSARGFGYRLVK